MLKIKRVKNIDLTAVWGCLFFVQKFLKNDFIVREGS